MELAVFILVNGVKSKKFSWTKEVRGKKEIQKRQASNLTGCHMVEVGPVKES